MGPGEIKNKRGGNALKMNGIVLLLNRTLCRSLLYLQLQHVLLMFVPEQVCNKK